MHCARAAARICWPVAAAAYYSAELGRGGNIAWHAAGKMAPQSRSRCHRLSDPLTARAAAGNHGARSVAWPIRSRENLDLWLHGFAVSR